MAHHSSEFRPLGGAFGRWRRDIRRRILEPILVGHRSFRETVLNALAARGHLIYCETPEGKFFVDPSDRVIGTSLAWQGSWQHRELAQAIAILGREGRLPADAVFVDVGANIGTHTVYALNGGRFARALCFEPEPANLRLLHMNIAANDLGLRATVVATALGAAGGIATLHLHPRNKGAHSISRIPSTDGLATVEVPLTRLDRALQSAGVAAEQVGLVSIDVEGAEPDVIGGLGDLAGRVPLMIEYAPARYSAAARASLDALLATHYRRLWRLGAAAAAPETPAVTASLTAITEILVF